MNIKTKIMNKIPFLLIVLAASLWSACSNDNDSPGEGPDGPEKNGTEAFAVFSVSVPSGTLAKPGYSRATDKGTTAESTVKTLHVFIYDSLSPHTPTVASFRADDGSLVPTASGWKTSTPIKTLKADKFIFAGINLSPAIVNEITSRGFGAFNYKEFAQNVSDLTDPDNGFVMFNATYPVMTPGDALPVSKEAAAANPVSIPVCRVVAKAAVFKGNSFVVNGGGEMQNIRYGWRNINKQFYFIQKSDGGIVKDYNWDNYNPSDFVRGTDTLAINPYQAVPSEFSYALENTFNYVSQVSLVDQSTFLSIRGQFRPFKIIRLKNPGTTAQGAADFDRMVDNPNGYGTFYTVLTDDGISNYFIDGNEATQYANLCLKNTEGMPSLSGTYVLADNTYVNGQCYFHVQVNSAAAGPYTPYGIYRNQYYRVTLNSIQAPGNPNDNFDKGEVINPNTWVDIEITVVDWAVVDEEQDL